MLRKAQGEFGAGPVDSLLKQGGRSILHAKNDTVAVWFFARYRGVRARFLLIESMGDS
jgi:hypothetical protein